MAASCRRRHPILVAVAAAVFFFFFQCGAAGVNWTAPAVEDLLARMNKPAAKTIKAIIRRRRFKLLSFDAAARLLIGVVGFRLLQSPDGDIIDCVPVHLQPAFDHPALSGQPPELEPPELPKGAPHAGDSPFLIQAWTAGGESCPNGTVPIRRTTAADILRASDMKLFARKPPPAVRRDSTGDGHEHAVGFVSGGGGEFYGARASLNVWSPRVATAAEFSLSQLWLISGGFGNDLNTIEAGWQVSPELYGDASPRFFTYWTTDAYQATGCYNLNCAGFVQTNSRIAIGAAISPTSAYNGRQFDITLLIWKDPRRGHWWLQLGSALVGYWPAALFSRLGRGGAGMVQFGGEVVNARPAWAPHTATQMGSGRFAEEGPGRAAYFRQLQTVDWDNNLVAAAGVRALADRPGCYDVRAGYSRDWGDYIYYGGPGRNPRCP